MNINMNPQQSCSKIISFQKLKEKYEISQYGFLFQDCLTELPKQFEDYQSLKEYLPDNSSSKFGQIADSMVYQAQKYSFKNLQLGQKQIKFMYSFFTLCYSRYVWQDGVNNPRKIIPQIIAMPFLQLCQIIGIKPSIAYASQITYNWGFIQNTKQINIQNLFCPMTMSGTRDQEWFYLIMIAIQIIGKDIIVGMYNAPYLQQKQLLSLLQKIQKDLKEMKRIIKRMYQQNSIQAYSQKIRHYLMGTKSIPGGVTVKDTDINICQTGGSAAQCPLIQAITIFLRIQLHQTRKQFIQRNKQYMPRVHRQFLNDLEKMPSIKQKIEKSQNMSLIQSFNSCIEALHQLRGAHFGIVDNYVFKHLKNEKAKGTGSSDAKGFLSQMMKDTSVGKIVLNEDIIKNTEKKQEIHKNQQINNRQNSKSKIKTILMSLLLFGILAGLLFIDSNIKNRNQKYDQAQQIWEQGQSGNI